MRIFTFSKYILSTSPISNSPISISRFLPKFSTAHIHDIYIYIYIYTHFCARLLKWNRYAMGSNRRRETRSWLIDERPRTTAAKKRMFFAAAAWLGIAVRRDVTRGCISARDRLSSRSEDKPHLVTKCSM